MNGTAACLLVALLAGGSVQDDAAEAARLARAGSHREALARFRSLAARNPRDLDARVWMARLLVWTGERREAEQTFRAVLAEAPGAVDAMLGLASLLAADGRIGEALGILSRAERLHPERAETLAALGRVHRLAGRTGLALSYYERAARLAPGDADVTGGLETTRLQHRHRAHATFSFERFSSPTPAGRTGDMGLNLRLDDRLRLEIHQQVQGRFGRTEARLGAGLEWRLHRATVVRAGLSGAAGAEVFPGLDVAAEVERSGARADLAGSVRFARFSTAAVWVAAPGVTVPVNERLAVSGRYYASFTSFEAAAGTVVNHSVRLAMRARIRPRLYVDGSYARGNESFETFSIDRIGRFRADTFGAGLRLDTTSLASLTVASEYQRGRDRRLVRVTAGVTQRF